MKKINSIWLCSLFVLGFQMTGYSQTNTTLGTNANPNSNGSYNTAIGFQSMQFITGGELNVAIGSSVLRNNTTGVRNLAFGHRTLESNDIGNHNVAIGYYSLPNLSGGSSGNVTVGYWTGGSLVSGSNNVFIGNKAGPDGVQSFSNRLFIGNNQSNFPLIWGDMTSTSRYLRVNLRSESNGVGGTNSRFEINAPLNNMSGLRFTRLNGNFVPPISTNDRFLTVNNEGDVVLLRLPAGNGGGGIDTNIYFNNGALSSDRFMNMNNFNLHFDTSTSSSTTGKIYIGDTPDYPTTTGNYKLYVEGGILTEKVKVALRNPNTNWADYVFADDYKLQSLKEVETFINANKHLPGIESAQELVENGLDLGEMQAKQMGKIEELTLYIIEQDKKLEQQSKDIEELKRKLELLLNDKN